MCKYNLLSVYSVTFIHVVGVDHLVLDNQLVWASLGRLIYFPHCDFRYSLVAFFV